MKTTTRWFFAALALALTACGGGLLGDQGRLRLVNATSESGALDLYADGDAIVTGISSYTTSGYANRKQDPYSLEIRQSGVTLVTTSTSVVADRDQTVVAYNSGGTMAAAVLEDEEGEPSRGRAKLRIFNTATADADRIDVYLITAACSTLDASTAAPTATSVSGLQSAYAELSSSDTAYRLCVTAAGDKGDVRLEIPSFVLSDRRIVTVILARGTAGYLLNAIVLDQQGAATQALNASARVRAATSVPTPVDVEVNGKQIAAGLAAPNVGPYTLVPAGAISVKVNGADIAATAPLTAAPGADVTVLLTGSTPTVTLLPDDNTPSTSSARPVRIRLVNGLNGTTGTATLTLNNLPLGSGAAPRQASSYSQVAASAGLARLEARIGSLRFYFDATATLESGRVYTLFLLGDGTTASDLGILIPDR
ncbi:MAG: DUF4397 domain-containing protein [Caldimonas sp.]